MYAKIYTTDHKPKGRGRKANYTSVGYIMNFKICATEVSKYFHMKRYTHGC